MNLLRHSKTLRFCFCATGVSLWAAGFAAAHLERCRKDARAMRNQLAYRDVTGRKVGRFIVHGITGDRYLSEEEARLEVVRLESYVNKWLHFSPFHILLNRSSNSVLE